MTKKEMHDNVTVIIGIGGGYKTFTEDNVYRSEYSNYGFIHVNDNGNDFFRPTVEYVKNTLKTRGFDDYQVDYDEKNKIFNILIYDSNGNYVDDMLSNMPLKKELENTSSDVYFNIEVRSEY